MKNSYPCEQVLFIKINPFVLWRPWLVNDKPDSPKDYSTQFIPDWHAPLNLATLRRQAL